MTDVDTVRALLQCHEREAQRTIAELGGTITEIVSARQDSNNDDEHDPEGPTLAFERSQSDALLRQAEQRLQDIAASLAQLDAGTYGICKQCGQPIGSARLEARPFAGTCISCAR